MLALRGGVGVCPDSVNRTALATLLRKATFGRRILAICRNLRVMPQVAHGVALAPPRLPAVREASLANEPFATWASPSVSAPLHQEQPPSPPLRAEVTRIDSFFADESPKSLCPRIFGIQTPVMYDDSATPDTHSHTSSISTTPACLSREQRLLASAPHFFRSSILYTVADKVLPNHSSL